jgi:hypothetical protein
MAKPPQAGKWNFVEIRRKMLCLPTFLFSENSLWKSPVDKPVENVEKFRFSTAISGFSNGPSRKNPADLWINSLSF